MRLQDVDRSRLSLMMAKYAETKDQYPDAILMYRLGDFYEMFFEDAETASRVLELTLTGRDCGLQEGRAPMCGVPFHAVDTYITRLVNKGYKVAICEQLSTVPAEGEKIVARQVTRVITAGTAIDDGMVDSGKSNYLVSVFLSGENLGLAWADITTGEFNLFEKKTKEPVSALEDFFAATCPSEIIANASACELNEKIPSFITGKFNKMQAYYDWAYKVQNAKESLQKSLKVTTLDAFEVGDKSFAVSAAGALNEYMLETQKRALPQFTKLTYFNDKNYMVLDSTARRNLEIFETNRDRKKQGSLFWVLDKTSTGMGTRMLHKWLDYPSLEEKVIVKRQNAVEYLMKNNSSREKIKSLLNQMYDLERLAGKCAYGNVNPFDMLSIANTMKLLPEIKALLANSDSELIKKIDKALPQVFPVADELLKAIDKDHCSAEYKNGGFIRKGYNNKLDEYKDAKELSKSWLEALEASEKEETGIKTLHIGYNKVFGYYIEVSKMSTSQVPFRYHRKQTLVNGERYITDELKTIEEKVLSAEANATELELKIFDEFKKMLLAEVSNMLIVAGALATLDALMSLAEVALDRGYVKPNISAKIKTINIENGRHPVIEAIIGRKNFTPNSTTLNNDCRTIIITGPNMAGKSTYMRQVALITIMAHIGSFVPATSADIAITDRIFTRIGASDDLTYGQSTFMVEMVEVATILNNATPNSLLILDEIGRGTSTYDGLGIAWAVMEYLSSSLSAKTLFATHYHELTDLEGRLSGIKNYRILANEIDGKVVFLHKIVRGGANKSFGVEVASLAGVPTKVIQRAKEITKLLEESGKYRDTNEILIQGEVKSSDIKQASFFDNTENEVATKVVEELKAIDINNISPIQAFAILSDLTARVR